MNNKISNPLLKQLISEIANKANQGRVSDLSWDAIYEAKKKKVKEADDAKKPAADAGGANQKGGELPPLGGGSAPAAPTAPAAPAAPAAPDSGGGLPPLGGGDDKGGGLPPLGGGDEKAKGDAASGEKGDDGKKADGDDDAEVVKTKAAAAKNAAEKDQAEKKIKDDSYIKLTSGTGAKFLLSKVLDHARATNTTDTLASDMISSLNIKTPQDLAAFSEEYADYRTMMGFPELIDKMKTMATKKSNISAGETSKD